MNTYHYFQTWQLQILTRFMLDDTPMVITKSDVAFANTQPDVDQLCEVILAIDSLKLEGDRHVFSTSDYSKEDVIIKLNDGITSEYIKQHLKMYIKTFEQDKIVSNDEQQFSFKKQLEDFCNLIDKGYNFKDFKLKSWKYIPVVLYGYFHKAIEITNVSVGFPDNMERAQETFAVKDMVGECLDIPIFEDEFLEFRCNLDIEKFVEKYIPKEDGGNKKLKLNKTTTLRQDGKFSNQQARMLLFIIKKVYDGDTVIPTADFYQFLKESDTNRDNRKINNAIARAISKLNKQYQQRLGLTHKVITEGHISSTYDVTKGFAEYLEDNYGNLKMILQ